MRTKRWILACALGVATASGACGSAPSAPPSAPGDEQARGGGEATDTRSEFERRLEAACTALGPRLTACAVADSRADLEAGTLTQQQFEAATKPDIQAALTRDWNERCNRPDRMSTRQVRVLEVCAQEETECAPLVDCLEHLTKPPAAAAP